MGTRSTYRVIDKTQDKKIGTPILLMYAQFDGYPDGHPLETAKWLASKKIVNGIRFGEESLVFNGVGCLAAQLVAKYKNGAGGHYIENIKDRGNLGEDYVYDIIVDRKKDVEYVAYEVGWNGEESKSRFKEFFRGTPEEYVKKYNK